MGIADWLIRHWDDLLAGWGALVALSSIVVKLTPTPKDDEILAKILSVMSLFSTVKRKDIGK